MGTLGYTASSPKTPAEREALREILTSILAPGTATSLTSSFDPAASILFDVALFAELLSLPADFGFLYKQNAIDHTMRGTKRIVFSTTGFAIWYVYGGRTTFPIDMMGYSDEAVLSAVARAIKTTETADSIARSLLGTFKGTLDAIRSIQSAVLGSKWVPKTGAIHDTAMALETGSFLRSVQSAESKSTEIINGIYKGLYPASSESFGYKGEYVRLSDPNGGISFGLSVRRWTPTGLSSSLQLPPLREVGASAAQGRPGGQNDVVSVLEEDERNRLVRLIAVILTIFPKDVFGDAIDEIIYEYLIDIRDSINSLYGRYVLIDAIAQSAPEAMISKVYGNRDALWARLAADTFIEADSAWRMVSGGTQPPNFRRLDPGSILPRISTSFSQYGASFPSTVEALDADLRLRVDTAKKMNDQILADIAQIETVEIPKIEADDAIVLQMVEEAKALAAELKDTPDDEAVARELAATNARIAQLRIDLAAAKAETARKVAAKAAAVARVRG